jgi:single-strand DNA-binding protein
MINKAILLGRVGTKEYKPTRNNSFLCYLSIATNRKWLDSHANHRQVTTWHNVNCFDKIADIANKYVKVGDLVYIEGEINHREIQENGVSRMVHSIVAKEIKFIPNARKDAAEKIEENQSIDNPLELVEAPEWNDESIPF